MTENIPLAVAFSAGLLSFVAPCVLSLAPVYLASLCPTAEALEPMAQRNRIPVFLHSLSFVIGFSIFFTALGAVAGLTGFAINPSQALLNKISGSLLIAFGLFRLLAWKVPWLSYEKRLIPPVGNTVSYLRSFSIGATFSLGWTACVGPILGGILSLALNSATAWGGAYLLAIYSAGLGLPFLVIGFALDSSAALLERLRRYSRLFYLIGGVLLIAVGILVLTNRLVWLSSLTA